MYDFVTTARRLALGLAAAAAVISFAAPAGAQLKLSNTETKCASQLGKGGGKLAKTIIKETAKCRLADISGKSVGLCPGPKNTEKIAKAAGKLESTAAKRCKSTCSISSDIECIADAVCPPFVTPTIGAAQQCSAGAKSILFNMSKIGFPGPYCETALGAALVMPINLGECVAELTTDGSETLIDVVFGTIDNSSALSQDAQRCLKGISKGVEKLALTVQKSVSKCRDAILTLKATGDPALCQTADPKAAAKILKAEDKLAATIQKSCTDDQTIQELDLCNNGVGLTTTLLDATSCLTAAAREIADSPAPPVARVYSPVSLIDAAYPPKARCGDNVSNQLPTPQLLLGEECDGLDDAACPGECLPPGDTFECTCGDRKRLRLFADHALTDADAGWTGASHEQGVADQSGYITELSNCDCDAFDGPTCIGTSGNPVCDVAGKQLPTCSWDLFSGTSCDAHGNANTINNSADCSICDEFTANAGTSCADERDCDSQCYDAFGAATGPCDNQSDCAAGEVCRGQCDRSQSCVIIPNGAPLPVSNSGVGVCAVQRFRTDIVGTRDLVTGSHELNYQLFSVIHFGGDRTTRPCPVCGGFCEGGSKDRELCEGRCSTSGDLCRFDVDCPIGETCSTASPDCPGGFCQLQLICGTDRGQNESVQGKTCSIEYEHPVFGTLSNDCLPSVSANITGTGFEVDYLPGTSGTVTLASTLPCTSPGFELFECPCPDGGGAPTKPNSCAPACNAVGPSFGQGCATGNSSGQGTTCAAGANFGKLCDEDIDCPGSTCSKNPTHCVGDPATAQFGCTTNADCGLGTCEDACPTGRCLPLCVPDPGDPTDGICAAGPPVPRCDGVKFTYRTCLQSSATSGACAATCSISATSCTSQDDCPSGETCAGPCQSHEDCEAGPDGIMGTTDDVVGAGACVLDDRDCYLEPLVAEGGSTLNGMGDPENDFTAVIWCYGKTSNAGINGTAGFGGPGRVLQKGINVSNGFTAIP